MILPRLTPFSRRVGLVAGVLLAAAVVAGASVLAPRASTGSPIATDDTAPTARIEVNTLTGAPDVPGTTVPATGTSADGLLSFQVASTVVAFGELEPGETSPPVTLEVTNTGQVPLTLDVAASALAGPDGASIPASRLFVSTASGSRGASLGGAAPVSLENLPLAAGASMTLYLTLEVPSGDESYVPQGAYAGTLALTAKGVTA